MEPIELSPEKLAIAKEAARIAVQEISNEFYKQVGKTLIQKVLIWVGIAAVAFATGKGWVIPK